MKTGIGFFQIPPADNAAEVQQAGWGGLDNLFNLGEQILNFGIGENNLNGNEAAAQNNNGALIQNNLPQENNPAQIPGGIFGIGQVQTHRNALILNPAQKVTENQMVAVLQNNQLIIPNKAVGEPFIDLINMGKVSTVDLNKHAQNFIKNDFVSRDFIKDIKISDEFSTNYKDATGIGRQ